MQQFTITLKDNTQKAFNSFSWFLYLLHVVIISIIIMNPDDTKHHRNVAWIAVFLLSFSRFTNLFFNFKKNVSQAILFVVMTGFWIAQLEWIPAIILIAIIIFARFVSTKKSIAIISSENITIVKSLFKKEHHWQEVSNVVLKDHLLSIDFKNNHLLQLEITEESYAIEESVFNAFCQKQLQSVSTPELSKL